MSIRTRLFVDAENIKLEEDDFMFLKWKYDVQDGKVYTSFLKEKNSTPLLPFPIQVIHVNTLSKKNSVDIQICVDVMESIFEDEISTYIIATHDRDFLPLYVKLKQYGKHVIVVGRQTLSDQITAWIDETCLLDSVEINFRILIKAFHLSSWKPFLTLSEIKRNIKRLNLRKEMGTEVFKNMVPMIETEWSEVFHVRREKRTIFIRCLLDSSSRFLLENTDKDYSS